MSEGVRQSARGPCAKGLWIYRRLAQPPLQWHLRHLRILSEKLASFVTVFRIEDMLSSLLNGRARLCN